MTPIEKCMRASPTLLFERLTTLKRTSIYQLTCTREYISFVSNILMQTERLILVETSGT